MQKPRKEGFSTIEVATSVAAYTLCSSLALIANKVCLTYLPLPALIFCLQISATIAFILAGRWLGTLEVDGFTLGNVKLFLPYIVSFVISLYSNGRALKASNIETVIVFRACSPLLVSILDWIFLGRELPSRRSLLSLVGVVAGAVGYVLSDSEFAMHGLYAYGWVTTNLCGIVFEMTYGKQLISGVRLKSPVWGAVLYTNGLSLLPMFAIALSTGERSRLDTVHPSAHGISWLALSCVVGLGISWAGWNCRAKVAATTYTLLGVVCKLISVLLNVAMWEKHATGKGLLMLMLCLVSSSLYKQAPLRGEELLPSGSRTPGGAQDVEAAFQKKDGEGVAETDISEELSD